MVAVPAAYFTARFRFPGRTAFLLLASRQEDPDTLFFRRRLVIEGDTELGLAVKNLVDSLDPDLMPPRVWQLVSWLGAAAKEGSNSPWERRAPAR